MVAEEKRSLDETLRTKIQQRAYEIWQSEGNPRDCDVDHWLRAEAEIMSSPPRQEPSPNGEGQPTRPKVKK